MIWVWAFLILFGGYAVLQGVGLIAWSLYHILRGLLFGYPDGRE